MGGAKIDVSFHNQDIYPKECRGVVEKVYRCFAVVKARRYRVTVHYTDLLTGTASVQPAAGPDNVVYIWEKWDMPRKKKAERLTDLAKRLVRNV